MEVKSRFKKFIEKFSFNKEKILVTGGLGYIGSHTVVELIESGFDVIVVDNLSNSNIDVLKGIEKKTGSKPKFENIDCSDYVAMDKFLSKNEGIQAIIHFAALKAVGDSVKRPLPYYRNNIGSMIALLELMQVHKIPNMVFSSSCTVYGQADKMPVSENTPIKIAQSPYGNTKQICEEIITDALAANDSLKAVVLRYFNPIGAHPSSYIGEQPNGVPENLVPYIVQTAAGIRKKLSVFGNDYKTPDGTCIRDYVHVKDLAIAHIKALEYIVKNNESLTVNLGSEKGVSVLEMLEAARRITGKPIPAKFVGRRAGDPACLYATSAYAREKLGWKAEHSDVDTLIGSTWAVYKNRGEK